MSTNDKSNLNLQGMRSRKILFFVSLALIIVLVTSCLFVAFNGTFFESETFDNVVSNEAELRNAVNDATGSTVITFGKDIALTSSALLIPTGKNITLTSSSKEEFYKLIGADGAHTIFVETNGVLKLDGIIVTHENGETGYGVEVWFGGMLILNSGVICNNNGGGVYNSGNFSMFDGEISGNTALRGGGVLNNGYDFTMSGGVISGNTAEHDGGGVYNRNGNVSLYAGVICGNTAKGVGGGVYNWNNLFVMSGGMISGNTAGDKGGGVYNWYIFSTFIMSGGEIYGNTAPLGGGVCTDYKFNMSGNSVVSGNTANTGGGVYVGNGEFSRTGYSSVLGNTASHAGDDVYVKK